MKILLVLVLFVAVLLAVLATITKLGTRQINAQFPAIGQFIEVNGLRLHYLDAGEQQDLPPVILLHGASSNVRDFASSILPALAMQTRVLAFDRPGLGHSQRAQPWMTPLEQCDLFLDAAARLGVEKPVVVGHSWSGSIVMACVLDRAERVAGGVSLSGVAGHWAGGVDGAVEAAAVPIVGPVFAHTVVYPVGLQVIKKAVRKVLEPNEPPQDYAEKIGAKLALRPQQFLANADDLTKLSEFLQLQGARYEQVESPLLFIHGEADDVVPFWNHGQRVARVVPHARVALLPGIGHAPHHVIPDEVVARIVEFAGTLPTSARSEEPVWQAVPDYPLPDS